MDVSLESARPSPSKGSNAANRKPALVPQVCDRCRVKRIGCDGQRPSCKRCSLANVECVVSVKLKRKTKPRKYVPHGKQETIGQLRAEVDSLRAKLETLENQIRGQAPIQSSDDAGPNHDEYQLVENEHLGASSIEAPPDQPLTPDTDVDDSYVIKHMGRLVSTVSGIDRFAGSTTGVHFIHAVEQMHRSRIPTATVFPDTTYSLHLVPQPMGLYSHDRVHTTSSPYLLPFLGTVEAQPYYLPKVERYFRRWGSLWPVLSPKKFYAGVNRVLEAENVPFCDMTDYHMGYLAQLCYVLAINAWDDPSTANDHATNNSAYYYSIAAKSTERLREKGDMVMLQSRLLASIYFQLTGNHTALSCVAGSSLRTAQSLGLHRHQRRFRFSEEEVELRNRMWWVVQNLDLTISLCHGFPLGINHADVDTALPTNIELDSRISRAPPSSANGVSIFMSFTELSHLGSSIIRTLYTTTRRVVPKSKIAALMKNLLVWREKFHSTFAENINSLFSPPNVNTSPRSVLPISNDDGNFAVPYLQLLYYMYTYLLHLPRLTFPPNTNAFKDSLRACASACREIITLLSTHKNERRLFYLQPNGTHLLFQCALMCLYESWHEDPPSLNITAQETVETAIELLELQKADWEVGGGSDHEDGPRIISSSIATLRKLLSESTLEEQQDVAMSEILLPPPNVGEGEWQQFSALEQLNIMDGFIWDFDAPLEDRSGLISFFLA